jgi:hypothetical protein
VRFRIEQRFVHPVEVVEEALTDPDFLAVMGTLPKLGRPELVGRQVDPHSIRLRVRYAFVGNLSPRVRTVVDPDRLTWVQDEVIDLRTHRSRFVILPDHYPRLLAAGGTWSLDDDGNGGSTRIAAGAVDVTMPLVRTRVERAIISGLQDHAREEATLLNGWATARTT